MPVYLPCTPLFEYNNDYTYFANFTLTDIYGPVFHQYKNNTVK